MKTEKPSIEDQLKKFKKRFYLVLTLLFVFIAATGTYLYLNYDYLAFKHFITQNYIYTDALDDLFTKELQRDVKGKYYSYFDDLAISAVTRLIRETNNDRYTYLYIPEKYKESKQQEKVEALMSEVKVQNDKTVMLHITNFSSYTYNFVKSNIGQLKNYPYLIIDLRNNYGGDISVMLKISTMFLPKGSVMATDKMRIIDWTYKSRKEKVLDFKKIIILQNKNTASSSENMIAALRDNLDNVLLIGETTYGKGIGQFTLPLKRGFAVKATTLKWYTPGGLNIQGKGIKPDIPYVGNNIVQFALDNLANLSIK